MSTMLEQNCGPTRRVGAIDSFSCNSAKSYIGKSVNLHLKDGAVIINVHLTKIYKNAGKNNKQLEFSHGNRKTTCLPLKNIAWAEMLNANLLMRPNKKFSKA